ncbi:MAG: ABC transporter permease [Elusimicrobia bacterium]|nr:ABC transporter permease [Elusimicrobiota bacterium]
MSQEPPAKRNSKATEEESFLNSQFETRSSAPGALSAASLANGRNAQLPYWWLAWKVIFYHGNPTIQKFSIVTAIGAIAVGVASLLVTIGVIDGFHREIKTRMLGLSPHVFIRMKEGGAALGQEARSVAVVLGPGRNLSASPFVIGQAMIRSASSSLGVVLKAVDPRLEPGVTKLDALIKSGQWFDHEGPASKKSLMPVILGREAARTLGVFTGSEITLMSSPGTDSLASLPKMTPAVVRGVFESGYYEYDSTLAYIPFERASTIWPSRGPATAALYWIGVSGSDAAKADHLADELQSKLIQNMNVFQVMPWSELNRSLFSALKLEKLMLTLVLSLIIFIASITVTSNLILIAAQKIRMIGSLRSMGITQGEIGRLMLQIGGLLGFLGVVAGLGLIIPIAFIILKTDWVRLPAEIYMIERVPLALDAIDVLGVSAFAWVISVAAAALPAYKTAKMETSKILRYG